MTLFRSLLLLLSLVACLPEGAEEVHWEAKDQVKEAIDALKKEYTFQDLQVVHLTKYEKHHALVIRITELDKLPDSDSKKQKIAGLFAERILAALDVSSQQKIVNVHLDFETIVRKIFTYRKSRYDSYIFIFREGELVDSYQVDRDKLVLPKR